MKNLSSMAGLYTFLLTLGVLVALVVMSLTGNPTEMLEQAFLILVGVVAGITIPSNKPVE